MAHGAHPPARRPAVPARSRPCTAGPAACRAPAPPAARAGCISQRDGRVPRCGRRAHGPRVGVVAGLRCPVRPSAWPALHAGRAAAAPACRCPASGQPPAGRHGRGCSPVGRQAVCGRECRGRLRVAGRVRLRHARARLDAAAAALRADGPAVRLFPRGRCAEAPRPCGAPCAGGMADARRAAPCASARCPAGLCPRTGKAPARNVRRRFARPARRAAAAARRAFGRAHRRGRCPARSRLRDGAAAVGGRLPAARVRRPCPRPDRHLCRRGLCPLGP